ncbi:Rieske (2Fe-2S) protein [Streptomyces sp. URMC 123]|uniref:Rieske (2Fe-2S) protein n=1 Tax=Streptomyces sp. URMC 123 TaxID=3423403 RepID=UPI003F1C115A
MTESQGSGRMPSRRGVVVAAGAAGLVAALAACGSDESKPSGTADTGERTGGDPARPPQAGSGTVLARTSEIPEGGGKVFPDQKVVVTQPSAGRFLAFSSICTHQGCPVKDVTNGLINCPCHGSTFDIADGSVKKGPATRPLPAAKVSVQGDSITLA